MKFMRSFLIFAAIAGLGALYLWQKHNEPPAPVAAKPPPAVTTSQTKPEAPREPSEHNWMKRSLDRARDLETRHRRGAWRRRILAESLQNVRPIDTGGRDADENFTVAGNGHVARYEAQHVGPAGFEYFDRVH